MQTILISGGTGMIGQALTKTLLQKGYRIIILTRNSGQHTSPNDRVRYASWDIGKQKIDETAIREADHIIHLAGAGVGDKRWTEKRKKEIADSRVQSGRLLVNALSGIPNKVQSVISASGIGWYGPDPVNKKDHSFTEDDPAFNDFLGQTCQEWETSIAAAAQWGRRFVVLRTGIVLAKQGGALPRFITPLRLGVAAIPGNGKQIFSWVHIDDLVNIYITAIENASMNGVYNAVAPGPVPMKDMILQLPRSRRQSFFIPVHIPAFALKILIGEMSIEVLKSATVSSKKIEATGFAFQYPQIKEALNSFFPTKNNNRW